MKIVTASLLILLCASAVLGNTPSKWSVPYSGQASASGVRYANPIGGTLQTVELASYLIIPTPIGGSAGQTLGTVANLRVVTDAAPGAGTGYTVTVRTGTGATGTGLSNTNLFCTVGGTDQSCNELYNTTGHSSTVLTQNAYTIEIKPYNTPAAIRFSILLDFIPVSDGVTILGGSTAASNIPTSGTNLGAAVGSQSTSTIEANRIIVLPTGGTISGLTARLNTAPGTTASRKIAVSVNTSITSAPTLTWTASDIGMLADTTTPALTVASGDKISLQWTEPIATPASSAAEWSFIFTPTTPGDFVLAGNTGGTQLDNAATRYHGMDALQVGTTEVVVQALLHSDMTIIGASGAIGGTAGGGGKKYDTVLRDNAADAGTTFTLALTGTGVITASGSFTPTADHLYDTQYTPAATPNAQVGLVSYIGHMDTITLTPPSCNNYNLLVDYSAGVDGATVTSAAMNSSTFGENAVTWAITSGSAAFAFSTATYSPIFGTIPTFCTNPWPGNVGTVGVRHAADNTLRFATHTLTGSVGNTVTAGFALRTNYTGAQVNMNMDIFDFTNGLEYNNVLIQSNGTNSMRIGFETSANMATMCTYTSTFTALTDAKIAAGVWVSIQFTTKTDGSKYMEQAIYDYTWATGVVGALIATSSGQNRIPCNGSKPDSVRFGHFAVSSAGNTPSKNIDFGPIYLDLYSGDDPVFPLLPPTCVSTSLSFTQQPSGGAGEGVSIGTVGVSVLCGDGVTVNTTSTAPIALALGAGCSSGTLNGTASGSAVAGVFTTTNLNVTGFVGSGCTLVATSAGLVTANSSSFSITPPVGTITGGGGYRVRLRIR